jgi:hypothetical protein
LEKIFKFYEKVAKDIEANKSGTLDEMKLFSSEHDLQIAWNSEANAKLSPLYSLIS